MNDSINENDFETPNKVNIMSNEQGFPEDDEWLNIQSVVKTTFKAMHHVICEQQQAIGKLQDELTEMQQLQQQTHSISTQQSSQLNQLQINAIQPIADTLEQLQTQVITKTSLEKTKASIEKMMMQKADLMDLESHFNELKLEQKKIKEELTHYYSNKFSTSESSQNKSISDLEERTNQRIQNLYAELQKKLDKETLDIKLTAQQSMIQDSKMHSKTEINELRNHCKLLSNRIDECSRDIKANSQDSDKLKKTIQTKEQDDNETTKFVNMKFDNLEKEVTSLKNVQDSFMDKVNHHYLETSKKYETSISQLKNEIQEQNQTVKILNENMNKKFQTVNQEYQWTLNNLHEDVTKLKQELNETSGKNDSEIQTLRSYSIQKNDELKELVQRKVELGEVRNVIAKSFAHENEKYSLQLKILTDDVEKKFQETYKQSKVFEEMLREKLNKSDHELSTSALEESIRSTIQLHHHERQSRVKFEDEINQSLKRIRGELDDLSKDLEDNTSTLRDQLVSKASKEELSALKDRKADIKVVNQWIQQHTLDINEILDLKVNFDDFSKLQEVSKSKAERDEVQRLRDEINQQSIVKDKISSFIKQMTNDFTEQSQWVSEQNKTNVSIQSRLNDLQKMITDEKTELSRRLKEKVDNLEWNRELTRLETTKLSRNELDTMKDSLFGQITRMVSYDDLKQLTLKLQEEIKSVFNQKVDSLEFEKHAHRLNQEYISKLEFETLVDEKVAQLRKSIDMLHASISQLLLLHNPKS